MTAMGQTRTRGDLRYTVFPPTIVSATPMFMIFSGSVFSGLLSRTVRSASNPSYRKIIFLFCSRNINSYTIGFFERVRMQCDVKEAVTRCPGSVFAFQQANCVDECSQIPFVLNRTTASHFVAPLQINCRATVRCFLYRSLRI